MSVLRPILIIILISGIFLAQPVQKFSPGSVKASKAKTQASFGKFYSTINALINAKNWDALNKHVHPAYGMYINDNPGVRTVPFNYSGFSDLLHSKGNGNEILINKITNLHADEKHKLVSGKVPFWDCGADRWNKKGSYCQNIASYSDLSVNVLSSLEDSENSKDPRVLKAKEFGKCIKKHVIQTNGYDMYFACINGNWYIAVIDVCDHCSA